MLNKKENGSMLLELLLLTAIILMILPIVYKQVISRNEQMVDNVLVNEMKIVGDALDRYVDNFGSSISKNMTKDYIDIDMKELQKVGLPEYLQNKSDLEYVIRIIKKSDENGKEFLYGMVFAKNLNFTPLRTRKLSLSMGEQAGYYDDNKLYGAYGTWKQNLDDLDIMEDKQSIVLNTNIVNAKPEYLMRIASDDISQNTMYADIDMNQYDVNNVNVLNSKEANFTDVLTSLNLNSDYIFFSNNVKISNILKTDYANITKLELNNAVIESDKISLLESGYFKAVKTKNLYVNDDFIIKNDINTSDTKNLNINGALNIDKLNVSGIINIKSVGSILKKVMTDKIVSSSSSSYYWDLSTDTLALKQINLRQYNNLIQKLKNKVLIGDDLTAFEVFLNDAVDIQDVITNLVSKKNDIQYKMTYFTDEEDE